MLKVSWLGQAGLLFENSAVTILVDPYFTDSVVKVNPANWRRRPADERWFDIRPDVLICTHDHLDHTDPETLRRLLNQRTGVTVLAPLNAWETVRQFGHGHNYVQFNRHTQWTQNGVTFTAVKAEHSDPTAIGVLIQEGDRVYYITGDTLYNTEIFDDLPGHIDVVFLPINGAGNNMNMADAARFADRVGADRTVPLHFGLFDTLDPADFVCKNRVIPVYNREIPLN